MPPIGPKNTPASTSDFEKWYKHYFPSGKTEHRKAFARFYKFGCDLNYVRFVCWVLTSGDDMRQQLGFDKKRGLLPVCFPDFSARRTRLSKRTMSMRLPKALRPPDEDKLKDLRAKAFQEIDAFHDSLKMLANASPLFSLYLLSCFPPQLCNSRGDPGDRWGNFFLLAISEYLKTQTGKPNHLLTYQLFRCLRPGAKNIPQPKQNVLGRINLLRREHPNLWQASLTILKSAYQGPEFVKK